MVATWLGVYGSESYLENCRKKFTTLLGSYNLLLKSD